MFRKYINCEPINKFKPKFWISEDNSGKLLAIECQQSVATLRLGEF